MIKCLIFKISLKFLLGLIATDIYFHNLLFSFLDHKYKHDVIKNTLSLESRAVRWSYWVCQGGMSATITVEYVNEILNQNDIEFLDEYKTLLKLILVTKYPDPHVNVINAYFVLIG